MIFKFVRYMNIFTFVYFMLRLIYFCSMEFNITEQQIPMLMRLIILLYALKGNEFKNEMNAINVNSELEDSGNY